MAYVGTLINPRNGKFNVARAKAAGVPKGPMPQIQSRPVTELGTPLS